MFEEIKETQDVFSFQPQIDSNPIDFPNADEDFYTRQEEYQLHKRIKKEILHKKLDSEHSFKPRINPVSELLAEDNENIDERVNRLYNEYKLQDAYVSKMGDIVNNSYPFKPQINENSKYLARHRENRYSEYSPKKNNESQQTQFSFRPTLYSSSSKFKETKSTIQNYDAEEISHQKRIRQLMVEEMKQKFLIVFTIEKIKRRNWPTVPSNPEQILQSRSQLLM